MSPCWQNVSLIPDSEMDRCDVLTSEKIPSCTHGRIPAVPPTGGRKKGATSSIEGDDPGDLTHQSVPSGQTRGATHGGHFPSQHGSLAWTLSKTLSPCDEELLWGHEWWYFCHQILVCIWLKCLNWFSCFFRECVQTFWHPLYTARHNYSRFPLFSMFYDHLWEGENFERSHISGTMSTSAKC